MIDQSLKSRKAGILLPVASLPSNYGIGDFGKKAYEFVDLLHEGGFSLWQILPLNPLGYGHSPYQPFSSFAFDELYIDLEELHRQGYIKKLPRKKRNGEKIEYEKLREFKKPYLEEAFDNFLSAHPKGLSNFEKTHPWVADYSVFKLFKDSEGGIAWESWPDWKRNWIYTRPKLTPELERGRLYQLFLQKTLYEQWGKLHKYANKKGLKIIGDVPFYVGYDSCDVWANQEYFLLDPESKQPSFIAGVPPDYFSATGQRWGNPIYDWNRLEKDGFSFLLKRIQGNAAIYDIIRLDHFRAFDTYWKVPSSCPTAMEGEWIEAPGYLFFDKLLGENPDISIIAEDLGSLRPEVLSLRDHYHFPGMNVIEFTFDDCELSGKKEEWNRENLVCYLGTHDNDTIKGYLKSLEKDHRKKWVKALQSLNIPTKPLPWAMVEYAMRMKCRYAVLSMQDVLGLDSYSRLNKPGIIDDINWSWKMKNFSSFEEILPSLASLIRNTERR